MKGTILDFLKFAAEKPELAQELVDLAARYDFEFSSEELSDEELDGVAGGTMRGKVHPAAASATNMWESALRLLEDHAQRGTQKTQKLTRI